MGAPALPIAIGASTAFGAVSSGVASSSRNRAAREAANVQIAQLGDRAEFERRQRLAQTSAVRGRMRVLAGDSGFDLGPGGSFEDYDRAALISEALDLDMLGRNLFHEVQAAKAGLRANTSSPFLAGLGGAFGGLSTGLQIGQGLTGLGLVGGGGTT